jgi:hypothetical protein
MMNSGKGPDPARSASAEETAAVVAAIGYLMADEARPQARPEPVSQWQRAALKEGIRRAER